MVAPIDGSVFTQSHCFSHADSLAHDRHSTAFEYRNEINDRDYKDSVPGFHLDSYGQLTGPNYSS